MTTPGDLSPGPGRLDPRYARMVAVHGPAEGARLYLEALRWPDGVTCPRCAGDRVGWVETRAKHECRGCRYQFRVTAGTVLHDSHVPLVSWLEALTLLVESSDGVPANRLQAVIGGSYRTSWFVGHRIRFALEAAGEPGDEADPAPSLREQLVRTYHRPSSKYLDAYRVEARWRRAAGRDRSRTFRDAVHALLTTRPLRYSELVSQTPA